MDDAPTHRHMVAMLPWQVLSEQIDTDAFSLVPFVRGKQPGGTDTPLQRQLDATFLPFHFGSRSVNAAMLLKLADRGLTDDLVAFDDEAECVGAIDDLFEISEIAAFAGLAARTFTLPANAGYCNRSDFGLFLQSHVDWPDGAATVPRRRHTKGSGVLYMGESYHVAAPPCASGSQFVRLDEPLLRAAVSARHRTLWEECIWGLYAAGQRRGYF
jgi:hypothetical protein